MSAEVEELVVYGQYGDPEFIYRCHWCGIDKIGNYPGTYCSKNCLYAGSKYRTIFGSLIYAFLVYIVFPFLIYIQYTMSGEIPWIYLIGWFAGFIVSIKNLSYLRIGRAMRIENKYRNL